MALISSATRSLSLVALLVSLMTVIVTR